MPCSRGGNQGTTFGALAKAAWHVKGDEEC